MIWRYLIRPILFRLPAEAIHVASMNVFHACMLGPVAAATKKLFAVEDDSLRQDLWGIRFDSPTGLAAGFDKHARWFSSLACLGFSHIEIGTITAKGQPGNPRPRLFRLPRDQALINRMGFNNPGAAEVARNLSGQKIRTVLGINIGKSRITAIEEATGDYLESFEALWPWARYFTINVSSPNTPGLRKLQAREPLVSLLRALGERNRQLAAESGDIPRPLLLKIAPDLNESELDDIAQVARETRMHGLIATNTTISRAGLQTSPETISRIGDGGLSGHPLTLRSREVVKSLYRFTEGKIPIIGAGGIMNGHDAWEMIRSGASLIQVYTGFIYGGPGFVRSINRELRDRIQQAGLRNIAEAIGTAL